jgi:hypothetical protein
MKVNHASPVQYSLDLEDGSELNVNHLINREVEIIFDGNIRCAACDRATKKSFNQGYCYPCFKSLARCDMCIMKPETCHYDLGTCREPEWGEKHCMQAHYVYLANSSGLKVGITRQDQLPTRWIDQGAIQAIPLYKVSTRYQAGLIEVCLGSELNDKTNWRAMLKGGVDSLDLEMHREQVQEKFADQVAQISKKFGTSSYETLKEDVVQIDYPVEQYPVKISSYNLDKQAVLNDVLVGIKGQYLIFENGVINIRKFGAYEITLNT